MKPKSTLRSFLFAGSTLLAVSFTHAATLYWDTNGATTGSGAATGTWGTDMFWSTNSGGTIAPAVTATTNADNLFISAGTVGTTGTITVDATQSANSITLDDAVAITLSGGTAINLGSNATNSGIFATANGANTISTPIILNNAARAVALSNSGTQLQTIGAITGSASSGTQALGVTASGSGSITLGGIIGDGGSGGKVSLNTYNTSSGVTNLTAASNTYSGGMNLWQGTLAVGASSNLGSDVNTNNVTINNSGILTLAASTNIGSSQSITLDSTVRTAPNGFSSAGTAGPVGRLALLGLGYNGLPANISQADTDGGIIAINGFTGYDTNLSTLLSGKNLHLGAIGTSTFTGAAGTVVPGNGSTYRLGGGGGTLTFSTANLFTGANDVQVGSTLSNGTGTVVFGDAQDYSGATTVSAGTLTLNGANGAAASSSGITLNGGRLLLDSSGTNNTDRIGTVGVTLRNGGELSLSGNASGTTETIGNLAIGAGPSTVTVTATTANSALAGAAFSRSDNGTALIRGTSLGQNVTPMGQITLSDTSGLSFVGASTLNNADNITDVTKDVKIIPYLVGGTTGTDAGSTFVTYDDTLGFRALSTANHFNTTVTAGTNVRLSAAQTGITDTSINSLIIANGGSSTITDGNTLTVASGAVLFTTNNGTIAPAGTTGKLNFGSARGIVTSVPGVTGVISAPIDGSGGLIKAGTGTLTLSGTNTFTGGIVVNGGTLRFGANNANLGNAGDTITINGNTVFQPTANASVDRPIVLNNGAMLYEGGNVSFTTSGDVSGTGGVGTANVSFGAIMTLNGTNNTFEGPVVIGLNMTGGNSSMVTVKSLADSASANGRIVFASLVTHNTVGSIFAYTGTSDLALNNRQIELSAANSSPGHKIQNNSTNNSAMTVNTDLLVTGTGARILQLMGTSTATNAFTGKISDGTAAPVSLIVNTSGAWTLSGNNTHSGGTTLSGGRMNINSATALGTGTLLFGSAANTIGNTSGSAITLSTNNPMTWNQDFTFASGSNDLNLGTGAVTMGGNRSVTTGGSTNLTVGGVIGSTGAFGITKGGGGTLLLTNTANTYTGATNISQGTLQISSIADYSANSSIGAPASGDITIGGSTTNGTLLYTGGTASSNRTIRVGQNVAASTGNGTINNNGTGALTFTAATFNTASSATANRTLTLGGTYTGSANEIQGTIVDNTGGGLVDLVKADAGTWKLSGANTYTGNTTVNDGTLELADNAQIKFVLGATSGTNNSISGAGTVTLNGDFVIDTTAADALSSGSWTLENVSTLTGPYGSTFTIVGSGFTDAGGDKWTKSLGGGKTYTFDETTGILTLTTAVAGYSSWASLNGAGPNLNDDHDGDGVDNGTEYFLGGPSGNTTGFTALPGVVNTGGTLSVTWPKGAGYTGVYGTDFTVETSSTLADPWATESVGVNVTDSATEVKYTFPAPLGTKNFARLKVTGP